MWLDLIQFKKQKYWIAFFLVLTLIYFFGTSLYGIDFEDTFFHLNISSKKMMDNFLYPSFLSSEIISLIMSIFGKKIIVLRLINALILLFAIILPFIFINFRILFKSEIWFSIGIMLLIYSPINFNILGYDSISIMLLIAVYSSLIVYYKQPSNLTLFILIVITAVSIWIRLPNIILIPIITIFIYILNLKNIKFNLGTLKLPCIYLSLVCILTIAGYFMYYRNLNVFLSSSLESNDHDFKQLFSEYIRDFKRLSFQLLIYVATFGIYKILLKTNVRETIINILLIILHCVTLYFLINYFNWNYRLYAVSVITSLILFQIPQNYIKLNKKNLVIIILFFLFLFIPAFGSNTGLRKLSYLLVLSPFVFYMIKFKFNRFNILILIVLVSFGMFDKFKNTFNDNSISELKYTISNPFLYPIKTTQIKKSYLSEIDSLVNTFKNSNTTYFFYGNKSHLFRYLYPDHNIGINSFIQPIDNLNYLPILKKKLNSGFARTAIFLISDYPGKMQNNGSVIETEILKMGFKEVNSDLITYYIK